MSINRPRRIFRSGFPRIDARGGAILLGIGLVAAAGVALAMLPHSSPVTSVPVQELSAQPAQVAVVDGGTLRLRDQVVRLQGVEPPLRGTACGNRDEDCGTAATNALAAMVRETAVACRVTGADRLGRPYAVCIASGTELNQAVVAAGWARADQAQPALKQAEATARAEHRGVWARNPSW